MNAVSLTIAGTIAIIAVILALMFGLPVYGVWQQGLAGEAALARAEQDRQITVREAQAALDSAQLLNQAEVARAQGLADATALVVNTFEGPQNYLRYLWIQSLQNNQADIIYVPTEAGLPILEASKQAQ